ncbi:nuclear transport factor 2 family protein [Moraxella marmotae]|uniref:nuclear transport factor 2 family protein n=1 Tax=Moraxella marmotae TaxID=3344520 RepID=UPI0035F2583D
MNKKDIIRQVFTDIIGSNHVDETAVRQLFAADYVQKVDGKTLDLDGLIAHLHAQKQHIRHAQTEFITLIAEGDTVFSNHIVRAEKTDGKQVTVQVLAQFNFDKQGKILLCDELTRLIQGDETDKQLGSVR